MADEDTGATPAETDGTDEGTNEGALAEAQASIARLEAAIRKERTVARDAQKALKAFDGLDPEAAREALENAERAAEEKATAEGNWEELRRNLEARHDKDRQKWESERNELKADLDKLLISDGLSQAITTTGFLPEHHEAVRALMLLRNPKVVKDDGEPRAVFVDEVGDAIPLADYVKSWSETDKGAPYMPGTGQSGTQSTRSKTTKPGQKTISVTDKVGMGRSLEDIAAGTVEVVLD